MAQSKAVQKKEATEVAVLDTSMFEADADFNTGDLSSDDLALPFIDIIQATSSKHLKGIKGSVPGMMVNVVSSQTYPGEEGMIVVPCAYQRRFLEWVERGENSTVTGKKHAYPLNKWAPEDKDRPTTEKRDGDNFDWIPGQNHYVEETFYHYVLVLEEDGRHHDEGGRLLVFGCSDGPVRVQVLPRGAVDVRGVAWAQNKEYE